MSLQIAKRGYRDYTTIDTDGFTCSQQCTASKSEDEV